VSDILKHLNKEQKAAVEYINGPMMVIAGAGSGKTRVLTYKIAWLIQQNIDPFNILALTFTNKAAKEMKERVISLINNKDAHNVWLGTFHSIFARILRIESHLIGFPQNFTIYDTDDSKNIIKLILKDLNLDPKLYHPSFIMQKITTAKTNMIDAVQYNNLPELLLQDKIAGKPFIGQIYLEYQKRLKKYFAMDFDDILLYTYDLLDKNSTTLLKYQNKFKYILVDEYQDTNEVQYLIIKKLSARHENICVVGDDAQSIYSFRGANIKNILNFKNDYPDYKEFKLEQNYRSTKTIVAAANSIIVNNKNQIFKTIWTSNEEGPHIKILRAISDNEEGNIIANTIFEYKINEHLANKDFAVLYRTNSQSRAIEEALRRLNIPYKLYGGISFYKRKEIKDLLAYFRLSINPKDDEALLRIINYPARGIGKTTIENLIVVANKANKTIWEVINNPQENNLILNKNTLQQIANFVIMIKSFNTIIKQQNAYNAAKEIASSSGILKELFEDHSPEGITRYENVEELLNAIKEFSEKTPINDNINNIKTLDEFMLDIALLTDSDVEDKSADNNKVSLMTIHGAKGLEFPYVFICGLEENLFPSIMAMNSREEIEEERRLFYVALTRAQKRVFLSYAESRYKFGELIYCNPSRFIYEIDKKLIDNIQQVNNVYSDNNIDLKNSTNKNKLIPLNYINNNEPYNKFKTDDTQLIKKGVTVQHQRFGLGKVIDIEGQGNNKKATVIFNSVGKKQLLLKFAKLTILQ